MGCAPCQLLAEFTKNALDTRRSGYHVHQPVRPSTWRSASCSTHAIVTSISSAIFRSGQVIETFRGQGIWQPAIDDAIRKLDTGEWVSHPTRIIEYTEKIELTRPGRYISFQRERSTRSLVNKPSFCVSNGACTSYLSALYLHLLITTQTTAEGCLWKLDIRHSSFQCGSQVRL